MKAAAVFPAREILSPAGCTTRAYKEASDMKRAIFSVLAVVVLAGLTGCITQCGPRPTACMGGSCAQAPENCYSCSDDPAATARTRASSPDRWPVSGVGRALLWSSLPVAARPEEEAAPAEAGPATGQITYPYYTNRGPRDFLARIRPASARNRRSGILASARYHGLTPVRHAEHAGTEAKIAVERLHFRLLQGQRLGDRRNSLAGQRRAGRRAADEFRGDENATPRRSAVRRADCPAARPLRPTRSSIVGGPIPAAERPAGPRGFRRGK